MTAMMERYGLDEMLPSGQHNIELH